MDRTRADVFVPVADRRVTVAIDRLPGEPRCVAPSPDVVEDGMAFAVTKESCLWCTLDRGESWELLLRGSPDPLRPFARLISVALSPAFRDDAAVRVTTDDGASAFSTDSGCTWTTPIAVGQPGSAA